MSDADVLAKIDACRKSLSMPRVHQLVQSGMKGLCDWLEAHPESIRTARSFVDLARSGSQNADTIMSELSMRINAWDLSDIRATTAFNEIDLRCLIEEPTLFIVELRESELEMLRPLANVIVIEIVKIGLNVVSVAINIRQEKLTNSSISSY
jgi:hypothetical protein